MIEDYVIFREINKLNLIGRENVLPIYKFSEFAIERISEVRENAWIIFSVRNHSYSHIC